VVRAAIFDLDGTLLDRKLSHARFMLDQAERFRAELGAVSPTTYLAAAVRFDQNGSRATSSMRWLSGPAWTWP